MYYRSQFRTPCQKLRGHFLSDRIICDPESYCDSPLLDFALQPMPITPDAKSEDTRALQFNFVINEASEIGVLADNQNVPNDLAMPTRPINK